MPAPLVHGALAALLACAPKSYDTFDCGGTPINVPRDCSADGEAYVRTRTASFEAQVSALEGQVDTTGSATLAGQIQQLNGQLDQLTLQYKTTLVSLCQSEQMDPCNSDLRERVTAARESFGQQFLAARTGVDAAVQALESGDEAAAEAAIADATEALGGEVEEAPVEEPAMEAPATEEPADTGATDEAGATPAMTTPGLPSKPGEGPRDAPVGGE